MRIEWDKTGERYYEMGVKNGVLFPCDNKGVYQSGVAWNGLINVTDGSEGADATDLWADDSKYASFRAAEKSTGSIDAYTYPEEFEPCDGIAELAPGITIGQQDRASFGLSYRTAIGSDTDSARTEYKIHLIYGATASPAEKSYDTINDNPDAITFSWNFECTPVNVPGHKPTATIVIDSRRVPKDVMKLIEDKIYGTDKEDPTLPNPTEIIEMLESVTSSGTSDTDQGSDTDSTGI